MTDFTTSMIEYLKRTKGGVEAARAKDRAKKGVPDHVSQWNMMPDWLSAMNPQAMSRAASDKATAEAWTQNIMSKIVGDPNQTLGAIARRGLKPVGDKAFGTPPQQVVDKDVPLAQIRQLRRQEKLASKEGKRERNRAQAAPAAIPLRRTPARNAPVGGLSKAA